MDAIANRTSRPGQRQPIRVGDILGSIEFTGGGISSMFQRWEPQQLRIATEECAVSVVGFLGSVVARHPNSLPVESLITQFTIGAFAKALPLIVELGGWREKEITDTDAGMLFSVEDPPYPIREPADLGGALVTAALYLNFGARSVPFVNRSVAIDPYAEKPPEKVIKATMEEAYRRDIGGVRSKAISLLRDMHAPDSLINLI